MKRILLFNPPSGLYRRDNRCNNRVEDQTVRVIFPPIELLYSAAVLELAGHEVWVRDYPAQRASWNRLMEDARAFQPDIVLFTTTIATLEHDMAAAAAIKEIHPTTLTAAKGEPVHYLDREIMERYPAVDILLRGEVEGYLAAFVEGTRWEDLPGVTFRRAGQIIHTELSAELLDLNTLPFPARHLVPKEDYLSPETRRPLTTVVTSLGCPHKCIYCSVPALTGTNVRYRAPEKVVAELEHCVQDLGIREFLFHADTFTLKKAWVIELCQRIVERGLNIRWGCNSRVDTIDDDRLVWMKQAGCWVIGFGVESGNDLHLEWMKKRATADQAVEAIRLCRQHGVRSHAFFVFGFPWDTEESIEELVDFARALDPDFFDFNIAYPLPGTELETLEIQKGLLTRSRLQNGGYAVGAVATETLPAEALERWRRRALWKMYLRPHYIARTLLQAGSPPIIWNYLRAAAARVQNLIFAARPASPKAA